MTRNKQQHLSLGHLTMVPVVAFTLAFAACDGKDEPKSKQVVSAQAVTPGITPTAMVTRVTPAKDIPVQPVSTPAPTSFGSAEEAYEGGDFKTAARMYRTQVEETPGFGHGHYMLGLSSWKAGDFEGAKQAFEKSIEITPTFAKAYFNLGRVLLDLDRVPEAMEVIEKGRTIDSTSGEGLRLVARAQAESGNVDGAIATYKELLVRNEDDVWGLNNLGMLYLQRGNVDEALGPLARAVQVKPTAPLFLNNLGMALERSGHPVAALRRYELAVQHDSSYVKAVRNAERMKGIVPTGEVVDEVSVTVLAEGFRLVVRSWKTDVAVLTP
ncbi:MAG: tetratricopeptide repeat protein [Gemmatimonadaceae bacterium]|nr:tetratricopeptide repeat protein [Gemmatimonadaceae bacterium]